MVSRTSILDAGRVPGLPLGNKTGKKKSNIIMTCFKEHTKQYLLYHYTLPYCKYFEFFNQCIV